MATEAADFFKHCVPVLNTSLARCGALSICENTLPETLDDLTARYQSGTDWKILGDLLMTNFELKATGCGIQQRGLKDFLVANIRNVKHMLSPDNFNGIEKRMRPYLLADQKVPINNEYWIGTGGEVANSTNWAITAKSPSGIPSDARSFQAGPNAEIKNGERIWIESVTEGNSLNGPWQGVVVASSVVGDSVLLELTPQNDSSYFDIENPTTGIIRRGPPVVGQYESYCSNEPAYLNTRRQDYWVQWSRDTFCDDELTREFFDYVLKKNDLYKSFFHLPKIQESHQRLEAFWKKMFNNFFFSHASNPNQNLTDFPNLPKQNMFFSDTGLGFTGAGQCVGYVAENVGWMEQWQRCRSIVDLQKDPLNLWSIIDLCYDLKRVRFQTGSPATTRITAFADLQTAELIDVGMMALQDQRSGGNFRIVMNMDDYKLSNPFGLEIQSYRLPGKGRGIVLDIITDDYFNDLLSEWSALGNEDAGRNLWFLDPTNFYAGIVHSESTTNRGGGIADLSKISTDYQCVQKVMSRDTSILGVAFTSIVECAQRDRLLRNFSSAVPSIVKEGRPDYTLTHNPAYYADY